MCHASESGPTATKGHCPDLVVGSRHSTIAGTFFRAKRSRTARASTPTIGGHTKKHPGLGSNFAGNGAEIRVTRPVSVASCLNCLRASCNGMHMRAMRSNSRARKAALRAFMHRMSASKYAVSTSALLARSIKSSMARTCGGGFDAAYGPKVESLAHHVANVGTNPVLGVLGELLPMCMESNRNFLQLFYGFIFCTCSERARKSMLHPSAAASRSYATMSESADQS